MTTGETLENAAASAKFDRRKLIVAGGSASIAAAATWAVMDKLRRKAIPVFAGADEAVFVAGARDDGVEGQVA